MARAIKLIDAPIGLFEVDGILVLKTEYSTRHEDGTITPDCYIIESGEYFWGGVDSVLERNNLEVAPVDIPTITPPNEWVSVEERLPENHAQVLMWSAKWNIAEAGSYYNGRFWVYSEIGDKYIADDITHWMHLPEPPDRRQPEGKGEKS